MNNKLFDMTTDVYWIILNDFIVLENTLNHFYFDFIFSANEKPLVIKQAAFKI